MPPAEIILWQRLRNRQVEGYKFRRQYSIGRFVVDFYCSERRLAIEVDGESHFVEGADLRDRERQGIIEDVGIRVLRFTNREVYENLEGVLYKIGEQLRR